MAPKKSKNDYLKLTHQLQKFFRLAVLQNDLITVQRLVKYQRNSINIDVVNEEGISAIHQCCIDGNRKVLSVLLKAGACIDQVDQEGWSCLHACASTGDYKTVDLLLKRGANSLLRNYRGQLAIELSKDIRVTFHLATSMMNEGYTQLANQFLENFKLIDSSSDETASSHDLPPVTRRRSILKKQDSTGSTSSSRMSSSSSSSSSDDSEAESMHSSLRRNSVQFTSNTLFRNYVRENEYEKLNFLLSSSHIPILDKLDRKGLSAIHWAAMNGYSECIKVLGEHGANIDNTDPNGWTALHAASVTNNLECVKKLIQFDANVYAITKSGESVFDLTENPIILRFLKQQAVIQGRKKYLIRSSTV